MKIEFIPKNKEYEIFLDNYYPFLSNKALPEWYKNAKGASKLEAHAHYFDPLNYNSLHAKQCPAIQDYLSYGFIIPLWSILKFKTYLDNEGNIEKQSYDFNARFGVQEDLDLHMSHHTKSETENMDLNKTVDNKTLKLQLPYKIVVPEGYSLLYQDPFYHFRKDIRCLTGLVEADKWGFVSFPFEVLSDNFVIEAGTPLVHCFLIKREELKLELVSRNGTDDEYHEIKKEMNKVYIDGKTFKKL